MFVKLLNMYTPIFDFLDVLIILGIHIRKGAQAHFTDYTNTSQICKPDKN